MTTQLRKVADATMRWNFRVWGFGEAIALRGLLRAGDLLGDSEPFGFVHGILRGWLGRGVAKTNDDHVSAGRELIELHRRTGDPQFLELGAAVGGAECRLPDRPLRRALSPDRHARVAVADLGRLHGRRRPVSGRTRSGDRRGRYFDQAAEELLGYARALQDESGLFYHGYERDCGRNGQLWARGNGWALMGLVDTLALLPRSRRVPGRNCTIGWCGWSMRSRLCRIQADFGIQSSTIRRPIEIDPGGDGRLRPA